MEKSTLWLAKVPGLFLKHKDEERRKKYLARAKMIKNKVGELTHEKPESANYWTVHLLW